MDLHAINRFIIFNKAQQVLLKIKELFDNIHSESVLILEIKINLMYYYSIVFYLMQN